MSLSLRVERDTGYGKHFDGTSSAVLRVPFTNQLVFPALQPGRYELKLLLPGAALWTEEFVVTEPPSKPGGSSVCLECAGRVGQFTTYTL